MAFGLGENSLVNLAQGRGNFEAMIGRHGQWARWRQARKCPCADGDYHDIHCEKCGGSGDVYGFQREYEGDFAGRRARGGFLEAPPCLPECEILEVRDASGRARAFERAGSFAGVEGAKENEHFEARYKARTARRLESAELECCGGPGSLKALGAEFVMPFKFAIFSQQAGKTDGQIVSAHTGGAVCS